MIEQLNIFQVLHQKDKLYNDIKKQDWIEYIKSKHNEWQFNIIAEITTSTVEHYQYIKKGMTKEEILNEIYIDIMAIYATKTYHQSLTGIGLYTSSYKQVHTYSNGEKKDNYSIWINNGKYCLILTDKDNPFTELRLNAMNVMLYDIGNDMQVHGDERFEILENEFKVREYGINNTQYIKSDSICFLDITLERLVNYFKGDNR